jgi:hypothetical protein
VSGPPFHHPDPVEVEVRPRQGGPPRRMARLSPRDARVWHALGGRVASTLERRLGPEVVANRILQAGGEWRLETLGTSLRRLRRMMLRIRRAQAEGAVVMSTDVEDFFPSVTPDTAAQAMLSVGATPEDAAHAAAMIEEWASLGYRGLPIGPPASAVLANAILRSVDHAVGVPFLRWVDDYLTIVRSEGQAAEVLERMDKALARLALSRSTRKTVVGGSGRWLGSMGKSSRARTFPARSDPSDTLLCPDGYR